jgi:hypothetical protein
LRGPLSVSTANFSISVLLDGVPYSGVWYLSERRSLDYRALIILPDSEEAAKLIAKFSPSDILKSGDNFLYISGTEEEN